MVTRVALTVSTSIVVASQHSQSWSCSCCRVRKRLCFSSYGSIKLQPIKMMRNTTWELFLFTREDVIHSEPFSHLSQPPFFSSDRTGIIDGVSSSFPYYFSRTKANAPCSVWHLPTLSIIPLKLLIFSFIRKHFYGGLSLEIIGIFHFR